jgi:AcrR family transcriptional regulator
MSDPHGKLLEAAARVYGELGFRGATTRRIADEAGVNEITIFRHFGSKEALINEAIRAHAIRPELPELPEVPVDPALELTAWCAAVLAQLRDTRSLIRRMMSEKDERPDVAPCVGDGPRHAARQLRAYMARLQQHGFLTPHASGTRRDAGTLDAVRGSAAITGSADVAAGVSMLMSALFADAMGREMMPDMYPQPAERAAEAYVSLFLRALGAPASPAQAGRVRRVPE